MDKTGGKKSKSIIKERNQVWKPNSWGTPTNIGGSNLNLKLASDILSVTIRDTNKSNQFIKSLILNWF